MRVEFGDLQFKAIRVEAAIFKRRFDHVRQFLLLKLTGREVHGDANVRRPGERVGAGLTQHPRAELDNQSGFLGDWNEFRRGDQASLRMSPAQQRFATGHVAGARVDNRLIEDDEFAGLQRVAQFDLDPAFFRQFLLHALGEPDRLAAPCQFGAVHRQVGAL